MTHYAAVQLQVQTIRTRIVAATAGYRSSLLGWYVALPCLWLACVWNSSGLILPDSKQNDWANRPRKLKKKKTALKIRDEGTYLISPNLSRRGGAAQRGSFLAIGEQLGEGTRPGQARMAAHAGALFCSLAPLLAGG